MLRPIVPRPRTNTDLVRVQISEDLPRVQVLLRNLVQQAGPFEVSAIETTENGSFERFMQDRPDVLVVDLNLEKGSGLGLIRSVCKNIPPAERPLIIVVTNHTLDALQTASIQAGAHHFLDKSRDLSHLPVILQQVFQS
jgi:DNA-binding NarL/FixJ family response regulator